MLVPLLSISPPSLRPSKATHVDAACAAMSTPSQTNPLDVVQSSASAHDTSAGWYAGLRTARDTRNAAELNCKCGQAVLPTQSMHRQMMKQVGVGGKIPIWQYIRSYTAVTHCPERESVGRRQLCFVVHVDQMHRLWSNATAL